MKYSSSSSGYVFQACELTYPDSRANSPAFPTNSPDSTPPPQLRSSLISHSNSHLPPIRYTTTTPSGTSPHPNSALDGLSLRQRQQAKSRKRESKKVILSSGPGIRF